MLDAILYYYSKMVEIQEKINVNKEKQRGRKLYKTHNQLK